MQIHIYKKQFKNYYVYFDYLTKVTGKSMLTHNSFTLLDLTSKE